MSQVDFATLSPYHRALLTSDGSLTNLLGALVLEPVRTRRRTQAPALQEETARRWLDVAPDASLIRRSVTIEGARSGTTYLRAESLLVTERLTPAFLAALQHPETSIGTVLASLDLELRRELLWFGKVRDAAVSRSYRIYLGGRPAILINEDFLR